MNWKLGLVYVWFVRTVGGWVDGSMVDGSMVDGSVGWSTSQPINIAKYNNNIK